MSSHLKKAASAGIVDLLKRTPPGEVSRVWFAAGATPAEGSSEVGCIKKCIGCVWSDDAASLEAWLASAPWQDKQKTLA